jgi:hypothetical protein
MPTTPLFLMDGATRKNPIGRNEVAINVAKNPQK